jgi:seryl-tRNA(Sec) selenium transferase
MDHSEFLTVLVTLVGTIASFAGCLIWIVKKQTNQIERALQALTSAVETFQKFEREETRTHQLLNEDLRRLSDSQKAMCEMLKRIYERCNGGAAGAN